MKSSINPRHALEAQYRDQVVPVLQKELGRTNRYAVPRIMKVVVNVGVGVRDPKILETATKSLERITGQKPIVTKAKKSISNFKVRKGMPVGLSVTLRKRRMYDFLWKLIHVTYPRVRDFRGVDPRALDGRGNINLGFKEHTVFPEIHADDIELVHGLEIAIVTSAQTSPEAKRLLELLGFPFTKVA